MDGLAEVMAVSAPSPEFWRGKSVFVTGHTGFKGGWLVLLLSRLGAVVHGLALDPPTRPCLFDQAGLSDCLASDNRVDLADAAAVTAALRAARPDIVLHLAAQPLVRESYRTPVETFATNVMGLAHLLEAVRTTPEIQAVVNVTTDKCYENLGWVHPYRETDAMGGHDPYSASKACAEILTASWRASFLGSDDAPGLATARAGNVIGGGDWAADRLLPDCMRAFRAGAAVTLRYPDAIRPWQHVMEPLTGYLLLAEALCGAHGGDAACGWNFGPAVSGEGSVRHIADTAARAWGGDACVVIDRTGATVAEAAVLRLDSSKARIMLNWQDRWSLTEAVEKTVNWYRASANGEDMRAVTGAQIDDYLAVCPGHAP